MQDENQPHESQYGYDPQCPKWTHEKTKNGTENWVPVGMLGHDRAFTFIHEVGLPSLGDPIVVMGILTIQALVTDHAYPSQGDHGRNNEDPFSVSRAE